jgi:hypothetical protein
MVYLGAGRVDEATSLLEKKKKLEKKQALPWQVANAKSLLGGALLGQKKHADAEPLLLAGYEGLRKDEKAMPPEARGNLTNARQRLVNLYDGLGKKDEAAKYRKELETRKSKQETP